MKKKLLLLSLFLIVTGLLPLKPLLAQGRRTIPGVSKNCLNYMILETGQFACLSYSQDASTDNPPPPNPPPASEPPNPPETQNNNGEEVPPPNPEQGEPPAPQQ